jgi:hypothetical protein
MQAEITIQALHEVRFSEVITTQYAKACLWFFLGATCFCPKEKREHPCRETAIF